MTEATTTSRKTIPVTLARKSDGIIKRLNKGEVVKALLFMVKKDFAMEFLLHGTINEEAPSSIRIVSAIYNGYEYQYGPADARQTMILPANPTLIEELAEQVPESETNLPTVKASPKVAVKSAMIEAAKRAMSQGFTIDQIKGFLSLTDEEVAQLTAE
jgi:hypothetical protein